MLRTARRIATVAVIAAAVLPAASASAATTDPGGTAAGPVTLTAEVDSTFVSPPLRRGKLLISKPQSTVLQGCVVRSAE